MIPMRQTHLGLVVLGASLIVAAAAWWRYRQSGPPASWRRVGELGELWCYPIKSCGPVTLSNAECVVLGLKNGSIRDRVFMVTGLDKSFKTARTFPHMTQIMPTLEGDTLSLTAPGMQSLSFELSAISNKELVQATVWDQLVPVADCGDEVALWLSRFILHEDSGCRLVYYPLDVSSRTVRPKNGFSKLKSEDSGALPDASSFMIINESSVDDLNLKLPADSITTPLHFRPNFVVRGSSLKPYEEDNWKWVKVGNDAIFECVKPCTRCIFTNINPINGVPNKNREPLNTLKTYRMIEDPKIRAFTGESPVLGVHLAMFRPGAVNIGDPVFVSD